ncbi:hypothetical protein TetV_357 [Tetraselmis virus 1]|uniref:Uncharacterized protein n=1 Tax=Tetraselmis virus 1 TaxID=2060617 RepID=A0A2P0VNW5_9VIRU|nr:hypothetical protein QJ968_gp357 [Tetraselmis virus 1]AUF82449.1 hypothetical protein TetV_357 [Tetraselmis virus 1]
MSEVFDLLGEEDIISEVEEDAAVNSIDEGEIMEPESSVRESLDNRKRSGCFENERNDFKKGKMAVQRTNPYQEGYNPATAEIRFRDKKICTVNRNIGLLKKSLQQDTEVINTIINDLHYLKNRISNKMIALENMSNICVTDKHAPHDTISKIDYSTREYINTR